MKKRIFAAVVAFVASMSFATSAFAAAPGATNGKVEQSVTIKADEAANVKTDIGLELDLPAGAFADGTNVKIEADVQPVAASAAATTQATVEKAIEQIANVGASEAKVEVNTKVSVSLSADGVSVQPNGNVKVSLPYDGKSNAVAYVNGNVVEFFKLAVNGAVCSFETSHFSDYYMVNVDTAVIDKVAGQSATVNDNGGNNPGTGVALAVAPAALAVAFVGVTAIVSKKKRG